VSNLLAEEPDLRDLVENFVNGLDDRLSRLRSACEKLDWQQLVLLTHQLKGAAGSYGYPQLSELAATMEQAVRARTADQLSDWLRQLEQLVAAAHAGLQPE